MKSLMHSWRFLHSLFASLLDVFFVVLGSGCNGSGGGNRRDIDLQLQQLRTTAKTVKNRNNGKTTTIEAAPMLTHIINTRSKKIISYNTWTFVRTLDW